MTGRTPRLVKSRCPSGPRSTIRPPQITIARPPLPPSLLCRFLYHTYSLAVFLSFLVMCRLEQLHRRVRLGRARGLQGGELHAAHGHGQGARQDAALFFSLAFHSCGLDFHSRVLLCTSTTGPSRNCGPPSWCRRRGERRKQGATSAPSAARRTRSRAACGRPYPIRRAAWPVEVPRNT